MTKNALADLIKTKIYPRYIKEEPIISIRYANFSISVAKWRAPTLFFVNNEKISILEALATAGDLTIYGRRDNVLLVRQTPEGRQSIRIDLRDKNLIYSPYFYLQQNDVIYVQPNETKQNVGNWYCRKHFRSLLLGHLFRLHRLLWRWWNGDNW